jgi:hypothetical protein
MDAFFAARALKPLPPHPNPLPRSGGEGAEGRGTSKGR